MHRRPQEVAASPTSTPQRKLEAAQKNLEEATSVFPLGPEANELMGFVYLQGHNPAAAMRCLDIVASQHYPITFYAKSYSAHDKKTVKETKVELSPDKVHLVYLASFNPKTKSNDPPAKPAGKDSLGNLVISDTEPQISDADLAAFSTGDLKGMETKESAIEINPGKDEIYLEPISLTSDVPIQGVPARKFANNYSRLFIRYMGFDNTKLGKESMTGGEKFSLGMSFAAAGMSGYSAIASGGLLMASTTQMMIAMYAFNSAMGTLQENRAEQRQLLAGNQFKLIPSQSFELASRTSSNEKDIRSIDSEAPGSGQTHTVRQGICHPCCRTKFGRLPGAECQVSRPGPQPARRDLFVRAVQLEKQKDYAPAGDILNEYLCRGLRTTS